MEQWLARLAHNQEAGGSNPSPVTKQSHDNHVIKAHRNKENFF